MVPGGMNRHFLSKKNRRFLVIATLVSFCVLKLFNTPFQEEEEVDFFSRRWLSINLGNGTCEWTPPEPVPDDAPVNTTMIVSYPGSGKRLAFHLIEGIVGKVTADDWNFSEQWYHSTTIKSSYPHPHSHWSWSKNHHMAQTIMILRNPRFAFTSFASIRDELDYSNTWMESFRKIGNVYTTRPSQRSWRKFRDSKLVREMDLWTWMIDFWMHNGLRRNDGEGNPFFDSRCGRDIPDCRPVALLSFEQLYNRETGPSELDKLAKAYEGMMGVNVIDEEARECVYNEVMDRAKEVPQFHNGNRDELNPDRSEYRYRFRQLYNSVLWALYKVKDKYSNETYVEENRDIIAWWLIPDLLTIIDGYIEEVTAEFDYEWAYHNYTYGPTPL